MKPDFWFGLAIAIGGLMIMIYGAKAEDCPKGVPACKVVTISPEELATLTQPGGIFDQAIWANRSGMTGIIEAWKKKIETAPAGTVLKADEQK